MTGNPDQSCPLCHRPNACGAGRASGCWCDAVIFPRALLAWLPPEARDRACVCRACLESFRAALPSAARPLETERLQLRPLTLDDAPFTLELLNEPSYHRFIADRGLRTVEDARAYLAKGPLHSYQHLGYGLMLVSLKPGGEPVGMCGLLKRDFLPDPDIGFAFLERHAGRGYATESARAVAAHARAGLRIQRFVGFTAPDNTASMNVLQKLGLRRQRAVNLPGYATESILFAPAD